MSIIIIVIRQTTLKMYREKNSMIKKIIQLISSKKPTSHVDIECKIEIVSNLDDFDFPEGQIERVRNSGRRHIHFPSESNTAKSSDSRE